ncbi:sulfite exporter TauE/SafE family protein [Pseudorhodoplanes sp.]|uniref:sulfite exporter TauE/SafE family protein n=1 Tax=Pseudorhodoplanes sp. TaxID=1934341 RepID=UPI003D0FD4C6
MALPLDATALTLFLLSAFFGGITTGLAGFAMGLVVSGVWLHVLTPAQTAALIVAYGLFVQAHGVWKFRHVVDLRRVMPLIAGGAIGVPLGIALLSYLDPSSIRRAVGVLLVLYSLYGMLRPKLAPLRASLAADGAVGLVNGLLGGLTGLAGPVVVIWCQLTGVPHHAQRAIFQPVILAAFVMTGIGLGLRGEINRDVLTLFALGIVPVAAGIWFGVRLYGRLDEAGFRRVILILLLLSGLVLLIPGLR